LALYIFQNLEESASLFHSLIRSIKVCYQRVFLFNTYAFIVAIQYIQYISCSYRKNVAFSYFNVTFLHHFMDSQTDN
jgi:hypothetical protein